MAYRQIETSRVRKMTGAWHNNPLTGEVQRRISVAPQLNGSLFCFHLHKLSSKQSLSHTFSRDFFSSKWGVWGPLLPIVVSRQALVLRPRRILSLRLFNFEMAMAAFLFHVAETKLYRLLLWRWSALLFSLVRSQRLCLVILAYQNVDGVTWRYVTRIYGARGPRNNLPSWSRSYEQWKRKIQKHCCQLQNQELRHRRCGHSSSQDIFFRGIIVPPWKFLQFQWGQIVYHRSSDRDRCLSRVQGLIQRR